MDQAKIRMNKTVVVIPTYNEVENIAPLIEEIAAQPVPDLKILVVDDNSPDGTGDLVRSICADDPRVSLLLRKSDRGRGHAGREGFIKALEMGADRIVEMDGDRSHDPGYIPRLLEESREADVVIGSRFIPGGEAVGRGRSRDFISYLARGYLRSVLGIPVSDPTSGYRIFTRRALEAIDPESLRSPDPFIVTEVLYRCRRQGLKINEVPIVFRDRIRGKSKLKASTLLKYIYRVWKLKLTRRKS